MDLPSGFSVENWESEGNFDAPGNDNVSLALREDETSNCNLEMQQAAVAVPTEQSSTLQEQHPYEPEASINIPAVGELAVAGKVILESNLGIPVVHDNVDLYEQQFIKQHAIKSPQQIEINDIPLPNESNLLTQSLTQSDKNDGLNPPKNEVAQIENTEPEQTECVIELPISQETTTIVIDEEIPASVPTVSVKENVLATGHKVASVMPVPVQETFLTTFNVPQRKITEEYILPDNELASEDELLQNAVSESDVLEITQPTKEDMTDYTKREPEDLLEALNTSEENTETQSLEESEIEYNNNAESILAGITSESECNPTLTANGKSVIDLVLPVVDAASVTMTDPVSLRPGKPSASPRKTAQASSVVEEEANTYYTLPAHVIGRPSDNPLEEQKLRPGLKSSILRSQILSKTELVQELQERTQKKNTACKYPEKGDIFFAKTLTKRLASHISVKGDASLTAAQNSSSVTPKLAPLPPTLSAFKESKAKKSVPQTATKTAKDDSTQDDTDLLAILEGEVDDWTIDRPPPQLIEAASSPINVQQHPPKLDPSVERELALQQLSKMPVRVKRAPTLNKVPAKKSPRKSTIEVRKVGGTDQSERPLRKRKIESPPVVPVKKAVPHSNGATSSVAADSQDVNKNVAKVVVAEPETKQPRIFKSKRLPGALTNGTTPAPTPSTSKEPIAMETNEPKPKTKAPEPVETTALVTRELISPPRTYSSRIKKSTFSDDFVFPSTSKSRVVPVVGGTPKTAKKVIKPATKLETAESTTPVASASKKPAAKVVPKATPKASLKASPKKAKPSEPTPTTSAEPTKSPVVKSAKKVLKKLSEIDRLLMDEGAINMLYAVEQNEEKRRSGGGGEEPPVRKRLAKTTRHSAKELLMKTRLVKSAVQRLRNTTDTTAVSLRTKRVSVAPVPRRKTSVDSNVSLQSPPPLTPADPSSPTQVFSYPPRLRPPAEASRIIRRHSSSSNFSSRSASPTNSRRLSVDVTAPEPDEAPVARETRKRSGVFITKLQTASGSKKKKIAARTASVEDAIFQPTVKIEELLSPSNKTKLQNQMAKNFQKSVKSKAAGVKKTVSTESAASAGKGKSPDLTACLAEAVTAFIAEDGNVDSSNVPPGLSTESLIPPISPSASFSYTNLIKTLEADCQRRSDDSAKERTSPRQSIGLGSYKELSIRRHENMVQVILAPVSTKMMDSLNPQVLKELQDVLMHLQKDDSCRAVLITSTGSSFCLGLDFHSLIIEKVEKRKAVAQQFAITLKHFMTSLSQFTKPIIAGVHGAAVGLGVTMLPFFDMVFASDKATFYTPYAKLGQVPEGAAVVALPQLLGNAVTSELLYACRKLTATEALQYGLVTRILWPDRFHEELLPLINSLAGQSAQSMEATKALLRYNLRARVDAALESEAQLLVQHWSSPECQANFKRFLDDEDIGLQRQRSADV